MASTFGSSSFVLSAQPQKLVSALDAVEKKIATVFKNVKSIGQDMASTSFFEALSSAPGQILGGIEQLFKDVFASVQNAGLTSFTAIFDFIKTGVAVSVGIIGSLVVELWNLIPQLAKVGKQAINLGVPTEQLMGLTTLLGRYGVAGDQVAGILMGLSATTEKAFKGIGRDARAVEDLGLSAAHLRTLTSDQQFISYVEALGKMGPTATRNALAVRLFGETLATQLLPIFAKGAAGIREFIAEQVAMGNALTGAEMQQIIEASGTIKRSIEEIKERWSGMLSRLAVGFAPVMQQLTGWLSGLGKFLQPLFDYIARAGNTAFGVVRDLLQDLLPIITRIWNNFKGWLGSWIDLTGFMSADNVVLATMKAIGIAGAYVWDSFRLGVGKAIEAVGDLLRTLTNLLEGLRNNSTVMQRLFGIDTRELTPLIHTLGFASIDAINAGRAFGRGFGESAKAVEDWFNHRVPRLTAGYTRALTAATAEATAGGFARYAGSKANVLGSQEALSSETEFMLRGALGTRTDPMLETARRALEEARRTAEATASSERSLGAMREVMARLRIF